MALGELLGDDVAALDEGRVFVDGKRTKDGALMLVVGQRVRVGVSRAVPSAPLPVLFHANGLVVVDKPAELPCEPDRAGDDSLRTRLSLQLRLPEVHVLSRLDVGVSGLVLCATDAPSRRAGTEHAPTKRYLAFALGAELPATFAWSAPLRFRGKFVDDRPAETHGSVLACWSTRLGTVSAVELTPVTGRRHQLRVHCALAGAPLLGDRVYGGAARLADSTGAVHALARIALHAAALDGPRLRVRSALPTAVLDWARWLGADSATLAELAAQRR